MAEKKSSSGTGRRLTKNKTSSSSKRKSVRRVPRRKGAKIKLDLQKVSLLCSVIFLVSCICIAFSVLFTDASSKKKVQPQQKIVVENKATPATPLTEKKSSSINSGSQKNSLPSEQAKTSQKTSSTQSSSSLNSSVQKQEQKSTQNSVQKSTINTTNKTTTSTTNKTALESTKKSTQIDSQTSSVTNTLTDPKKSTFNIPPAQNGATIVIIIDDAGSNAEYCRKYAELPFPITIAVLPKLRQTKECATLVKSYGKELILHQPMQSLNHKLDPGPGKITVDMSTYEIAQIVKENLLELGSGVSGLNNHEGSEVTENVIKIGAVLDVCLEKGIYFLDSRTTANTKAPQAALERDMKIFEKSGPYIDNVVKLEPMRDELYKTLESANKKGIAIVIGHVDKSVNILPDLLREMYPQIKAAGYRFATPSMLR